MTKLNPHDVAIRELKARVRFLERCRDVLVDGENILLTKVQQLERAVNKLVKVMAVLPKRQRKVAKR